MMRYAYRCQMIIYYLQIIKQKVQDHFNNGGNEQEDEGAKKWCTYFWAFLAVFPFHKASGVNIASKKLRDLGWDMHIDNLLHVIVILHDESKNGVHISLKAKVFGISVHSWLPYLVIILLLLTLMVGSKFKWYEHVL